ncbi:gamma carbonic anhydrase family protein|jgi:carbonic anhydrase/acetyltransferase-like protein (isoleucine patch superfamily)|uniref:gamma carbonic anhydrase family protein n=1 Tax=Noviherbaspirillum TaxID=1344552 RepID=UPI00188D2417|nr:MULTISPECIES: gamma carbonic anhydrase family protein [Noviherbaspirillum]MBV0878293.1 gamma carbonic anhydrase family protein [Noviherbaspirillum sp. L7-7A]
MAIYQLGDLVPDVHPTAYVAETATVIGRVKLEAHTSVWSNVTIRGDNDQITIGENSNIQESAVLHTDPGFLLTLGRGVTVGHQAMLHGCTIGDNTLIGIQAVVLNNAKIGRNCLVGAGALVTENKEFPDNALIIGSPAKVARILSDEEVAGLQRPSAGYVQRAQDFKTSLKRID